jgi:hypothetical protein
MEISQGDLARLLIGALVCGFALAGIGDLFFRTIKLVLIPVDASNLESRMLRMYQVIMPTNSFLGKKIRQPHRIRHKRFLCICGAMARFVYDFLFSVAFAVVLMLLLYFLNDGRFRMSTIVAMFVGIALYRVTLCRLIVKMELAFAIFLQGILAWLCGVLSFPIRCFWRWTTRLRCRVKCCIYTLWKRVTQIKVKWKQRAFERKNKPDEDVLPNRETLPRRQPDGKYNFIAGGSRHRE